MNTWPHPAYVIHTPRLVVRCYERDDVDAVHKAVLANVDALRPWMPWIDREPLDREARTELVRRFRGLFDLGQDFIYGVFDRTSGEFVGGSGLHPRSRPGVLEIGYWISHPHWGKGFATETAGALTRIGFDVMGAARIEIRVEPGNVRSMAIPRKLGFTEEGCLRGIGEPRGAETGGVDLVVFGLLRTELSTSPAANVSLKFERFA